MSFIKKTEGFGYNAGYFLASADCTRETREIPQSMGIADGANKYVPAGKVYPANDATAIGVVYEPVDVTNGNMPGSVVTKGVINADNLPEELNANSTDALKAAGFKIVVGSEVIRP